MRNKRRLAELIEKLGAQRYEESESSFERTASKGGSIGSLDRSFSKGTQGSYERSFPKGTEGSYERSSSKGTEESSQNDPEVSPAMHDGQEIGSGEQITGAGGIESEYERAALMLGTAMLDRIGIPEGIHPIAVVVTLLERMDSEEASGSISDAENDEASDNAENDEAAEIEEIADNAENAENGKNRAAHASGRYAALPRPMRGSMGQAPETDYYGMSSEDFRNLREKIKRASRDGRRIRI